MENKTIDYNDINIVYEDNHLLVAVKPQNVPVAADSSGDDDLLNALKRYLKDKYDKPGEAYLGLVHRLDRPTGGVMVFAKTSKAAARLQESIKSGDFEKKYLAVTTSIPKDKKGVLKNALYKDEATNTVYCVPLATEGAKLAVLDYNTLETRQSLALLEIRLYTGRSHQIRVQLRTIGCPIFGDLKYGQGKSPEGYDMALWATEIRFTHPTTKEKLVFRVYPPKEEVPWKFFDINTKLSIKMENTLS